MLQLDNFTTQRLQAERLQAVHATEIWRMDSDGRIMATLGGVRTRQISRAYVERNLAHWQEHGHGLWILRRRSDGAFAGRAALRHVKIQEIPEIELGYALLPEFWGQGLATEIGQELLLRGFEQLGFADIVAYALQDNFASQGVMKKLGMVYEGRLTYKELPHVLYRMSAQQWAARKNPGEADGRR